MKLDDRFKCVCKDKFVTLEKCLDGFVDANALNLTKRKCFRCVQGTKVREEFAKSASAADQAYIKRLEEEKKNRESNWKPIG